MTMLLAFCWFVLKELKRNGIQGVIPSGQNLTQLILQIKRTKELLIPEELQPIKAYVNIREDTKCHPNQAAELGLET